MPKDAQATEAYWDTYHDYYTVWPKSLETTSLAEFATTWDKIAGKNKEVEQAEDAEYTDNETARQQITMNKQVFRWRPNPKILRHPRLKREKDAEAYSMACVFCSTLGETKRLIFRMLELDTWQMSKKYFRK